MADPVGAFRDDAARARFLLAFDRAMSSWPDRTDHTVQTSYGRTAVSASTAARDRTPALLLPGGGSTIAAWGPFVRAWETDRQVFAVDTIWDAGRSVQTRPLPTGVEVAAWLEETLDGIGLEKVHLVGFSYGGWVALNQLVRNPARLQSVTAIEPPGSLAGIPWRTWARMLLMLLGDEERYLSYLSWVRGGKLPESPALDVLLAGKREFAPRGTPRPERVTTAQWRDLRTPLTVVIGGRSHFVPRRAVAAVRRTAPSVRVEVFPHASHAALVDEPDAIKNLVGSFMEGTDDARHA
ncbi:alpha/beta fold hydrolase [Brachybacterium conglomeratum]|uniref:alpha/beta fold hydrolase n=1 Tax=Brachybacterium conglomeratum TaxID=47846 RepID=UPI003DA113EA